MVPVVKSAMRVIVGLESNEQNGYAFQVSFGELSESKLNSQHNVQDPPLQ
jgi:hypothetical protein